MSLKEELDERGDVQQNIDEVVYKISFIIDDLNYILSTHKQFCGGERELVEANYKLFQEIKAKIDKEVKIY